jgi:hypothetical protein
MTLLAGWQGTRMASSVDQYCATDVSIQDHSLELGMVHETSRIPQRLATGVALISALEMASQECTQTLLL